MEETADTRVKLNFPLLWGMEINYLLAVKAQRWTLLN